MSVLDVCAAVIVRDGKLLLATRPAGSHLAGKWEFPGGKIDHGESLSACIAREIHEELGLAVETAVPVARVDHDYALKTIRLHFLVCSVDPDCDPVCHEGQRAGWFRLAEVDGVDLAPADRAFVVQLRDGRSDGSVELLPRGADVLRRVTRDLLDGAD